MPLYAEAIGPTEEAKDYGYIQRTKFPMRVELIWSNWSKELMALSADPIAEAYYASDFIFKKKPKPFMVKHKLTQQQITEADIRENIYPTFAGDMIVYSLGPDDGGKSLYASPDDVYDIYLERKSDERTRKAHS